MKTYSYLLHIYIISYIIQHTRILIISCEKNEVKKKNEGTRKVIYSYGHLKHTRMYTKEIALPERP